MKRTLAKIFTSLGIALIICFCASYTVRAAEAVNVQIAPYYTEIDYMSVYNPCVEYPVLTYKGVTYIPMTYDLAERLGIAVGFSPNAGFFITRHNDMLYGQMPDDKPFGGDGVHWYHTDYTAYIPRYSVYVNGAHYSNYQKEYPFLNYKGVTYLPLTYELAYEELGLCVRLEDGRFYLNRMEYVVSSAQRLLSKNGDNIILNQRTERTEYKDELGQTRVFPVTWWEAYKLHSNADLDYISHIGTYSSMKDFSELLYPEIRRDGENENIYTVPDADGQKILYYKGEKIDVLANTSDYFGREYVFDDVTFIYVNVYTNNIPAPYTGHQEYIYVKDSHGTRKLSWDTRNNLERVIPDGIGGYYLCSDSYSPFYSSRWSTPFASVYHYKPDGSFFEISIPDINSITGYTVFGGRLYVKAMYYGSDKNTSPAYMPISAVNSGFYIVDVKDDSAVKLYPYVQGSIFISDKGGFYCLYSGGARPKLINFVTKRVIPIR